MASASWGMALRAGTCARVVSAETGRGCCGPTGYSAPRRRFPSTVRVNRDGVPDSPTGPIAALCAELQGKRGTSFEG